MTSSRPSFSRSFSSGYDADGQYRPVHDLRHTQSLPASFPDTHSWGHRKNAITGLGLKLNDALPSTLITHVHPHPVPAAAPEQGTKPTSDAPHVGFPMRRSGWGAGRMNQNTPHAAVAVAPPPVSDPTRNMGLGFDDETSLSNALRPSGVTLSMSRAGTDFEAISPDSEEFLVHPFRAPGRSTPVPWPTSPTSPMTEYPVLNGSAATTPPGAPLLPSTSRLGVHQHFPGLDHGAGGIADEDALMRPLLAPGRGRSHVGFRTANA